MISPKQVWRLLKQAFQAWSQDRASQLAAALAYYTLFSLAPLLILAIAIASLFFDNDAVRDQLMGQVEALMGSASADFVRTVLENANRPGENTGWVASAISVGLLLVGATGVLTQLQLALNTIWNLEARPGVGILDQLRKRLLSLGMIIVIGFLLLVSLIATSVISGLSDYLQSLMPGLGALVQLFNIVVAFGLTTLLFAMMFKYLPDAIIAWRNVWFGAAATAVLFSVGKYLIGLYLGNSGFASSYGAAGSVVILLVWVFYSAQILFYGAELTQVYSRSFGSPIRPNQYAVERKPTP
ncbi:YihY/virulence factor BrkB family protein [Nodosilinea sp. PGN35]|uniref:YihY/virulence factor BrkB family protein n=1 Tax=Nodosilinea sp. PGN35 TaxID=3020489 RepID=UPI0023B21666|nr:YihY/virulence factor BrkB family protein [Nodosilinea sp. TSF1-S3]MDF0366664.1 YihY/virulence factor BrkB family protein [Nodosilinea sp. TSF1-S3]